jgi:hypothetical protein
LRHPFTEKFFRLMSAILIALLVQLGLLSSEAAWHQLAPPQQQELSDFIIIEDIKV